MTTFIIRYSQHRATRKGPSSLAVQSGCKKDSKRRYECFQGKINALIIWLLCLITYLKL